MPLSNHAPRYQPIESDCRQDDRVRVSLRATVGARGPEVTEAYLENLSAGGFRMRTAQPLEKDAIMMLRLGGLGRVEARVVHISEGGYGCRFTVPLSDAQMAAAHDGGVVVYGDFPPRATGIAPEPVVPSWPRWLRLAVILGGSAAGWATLWLAFH